MGIKISPPAFRVAPSPAPLERDAGRRVAALKNRIAAARCPAVLLNDALPRFALLERILLFDMPSRARPAKPSCTPERRNILPALPLWEHALVFCERGEG